MGVNLGGPVPDELTDDSYAKMKPGLNAGFTYSIPLSEKFFLQPELGFQFFKLNYGQLIKKDTVVTVEIPLQNGNTLTTDLDTYYKANISGFMRINGFKAGGFAAYKLNRIHFCLGAFAYYFSGGYDKGYADVSIGEGGVSGLDNYIENFNNTAYINRFSLEAAFRTSYNISQKLDIGFQLNRSLTPFFNKNLYIEYADSKFYTTTASLSIVYHLPKIHIGVKDN